MRSDRTLIKKKTNKNNSYTFRRTRFLNTISLLQVSINIKPRCKVTRTIREKIYGLTGREEKSSLSRRGRFRSKTQSYNSDVNTQGSFVSCSWLSRETNRRLSLSETSALLLFSTPHFDIPTVPTLITDIQGMTGSGTGHVRGEGVFLLNLKN